jgi:hypothetical protein
VRRGFTSLHARSRSSILRSFLLCCRRRRRRRRRQRRRSGWWAASELVWPPLLLRKSSAGSAPPFAETCQREESEGEPKKTIDASFAPGSHTARSSAMPKHHKNKMKSKGCKSSPQHKKTSSVATIAKRLPQKKTSTVATSSKKKSAYIQTGPQVKKRTKWKPLHVHLAGLKKPEQ